jgi:hypothetical protein
MRQRDAEVAVLCDPDLGVAETGRPGFRMRMGKIVLQGLQGMPKEAVR